MVAGKVAQSAAKRWLGDAGTYPILITCVFATAVCGYQCTRMLTGHPDIAWNKEKRSDIFRHDSEYGADWQSHRRKVANWSKNVVNEAKGL